MDSDEKNKVFDLCSQFLGNSWTDGENIEIEQLLTGCGNHTYRCRIKECDQLSKNKDSNHKDVIVRLYQNDLFSTNDTIKFNGETGEAIIVHILAERGLAPKLLGVFNGGMIVEHINGRASSSEDWQDMELSAVLARKLAYIHSLEIPISKRPQYSEKVVAIARRLNKKNYDPSRHSDLKQKQLEIILKFPFEEEYQWIQSLESKIGHKIVFCHNDCNASNILLKNEFTSLDDRLVFIDFELSTYYYRAFDLAYFLKMKDMKRVEKDGEFFAYFEKSDDCVRQVLISEYLKEARRLNPDAVEEDFDTFERLSFEVHFFQMVFCVLMIGIYYGHLAAPKPKFDFPCDTTIEMIQEYATLKRSFLEEYSESNYLK